MKKLIITFAFIAPFSLIPEIRTRAQTMERSPYLETSTWNRAHPIYVGKDLYTRNSLLFGFFDIPTEARLGFDDGNIAGFSLEVAQALGPNLSWSAALPAYTITKEASGLRQETNLGNASAGLKFVNTVSRPDGSYYGYGLATDVYFPTARRREAEPVALASPALHFFDYFPYSTSIQPRMGAFMGGRYWAAKMDLSYIYQYISKHSFATGAQHRHNFAWQTAGSWRPTTFLDVNVEYNAVVLDYKTANPEVIYRHALAPSVSGRLGPVAGNIFVNFPLDEPTRKISNLAFGLRIGLAF